VVCNGIEFFFGINFVGLYVIAFNWEGSIRIFPNPIDSSFGDVLHGKEAFSLDWAVFNFHSVKAGHSLLKNFIVNCQLVGEVLIQ